MQEWVAMQVFLVRFWGKMGRKLVCNDNGRLLQFSSDHNHGVSNTWFPYKRINNFTWECRGRGLRSIVDYFLIGIEARKQVNGKVYTEECRNWKQAPPCTYESEVEVTSKKEEPS